MDEINSIEDYKEQVLPAIKSKVDEFHLLGYDRANELEIWNCLKKKVWKKKNEEKRLHEIVHDILSLSPTVFMNYLTVQAYTGPDYFSEQKELSSSLEDILGDTQ
jgi:hypothetical protein